jgi:hypothetical protein
MGGTRDTGITVYLLIFYPGVMLHEITHFFAAALLGVPTGEIVLLPKRQAAPDARVTLGSVKVGKSDFLRESLIGAAPFFSGCALIYCLVAIFIKPILIGAGYTLGGLVTHLPALVTWQLMLALYLILTIGNTMFSSREDIRSWPVVLIVSLLILGILSVMGLTGNVELAVYPYLVLVLRPLILSFLVVLAVDGFMVGLMWCWQKILERLTHRRIIPA